MLSVDLGLLDVGLTIEQEWDLDARSSAPTSALFHTPAFNPRWPWARAI